MTPSNFPARVGTYLRRAVHSIATFGKNPNCAEKYQPWDNLFLVVVVAALTAVGISAAGFKPPHLLHSDLGWLEATAVWALLVLLAVALVALAVDLLPIEPTHAHCGDCGYCSVVAGVPTERRRRRLTARLNAAGWSTRDRFDLCPACRKPAEALERYEAAEKTAEDLADQLGTASDPHVRSRLLRNLSHSLRRMADLYREAFGRDEESYTIDGRYVADSLFDESILYLLLADVEWGVANKRPRRRTDSPLEPAAGKVLDAMSAEPSLERRTLLLEELAMAVESTVGYSAATALYNLPSPGYRGWMTPEEHAQEYVDAVAES